MGYRSQVGIELDARETDILEAACKLNKDLNVLVSDADDFLGFDDKFGTRIYWSHIKWYDSYPEVQMVQKMLDEFDEESYTFIRLGEDLEDNDYRGCGDSSMYINRSIQW